MASASTSSTTTSTRPFWKGRARADYPGGRQGAADQPARPGDVLPRRRAEIQAAGRLPGRPPTGIASYLTSFPDAPDSAGTNYLLADALFESHQYSEAATEYEHTAYGYPKDAKSAAAAYAALVSYQKGEESLTGAAKTAWQARAIDANVKFAQTFPEHPDSSGVLTRAAEDIFASDDLPRSIQVSQSASGAQAAGGYRPAAHRLEHHRPVPVRLRVTLTRPRPPSSRRATAGRQRP